MDAEWVSICKRKARINLDMSRDLRSIGQTVTARLYLNAAHAYGKGALKWSRTYNPTNP